MKKTVLALLCSMALCGLADVSVKSMSTSTWGYEIHGLGVSGNEVALVFTNTVETMNWTVPADVASIRYLVVGGGGGGGSSYGGGGGAGGFKGGDSYPVSAGQAVEIKVGVGGSSSTEIASVQGSNGGESWLNVGVVEVAKTAGGGGGGGWAKSGKNGACGGGGSVGSGGVSVSGGTGSEGKNGAAGTTETGGGGGGFTADGSGKDGGAGQTSDITGEPLGYAGGGGGGVRNNGKTAGVGKDGGGTGGGAVGDASAQYTLATAGVRGGGGGGGGVKDDDNSTAKWKFGAKGGDGVVVIRYATSGDEPTPEGRTISNVSFASGVVSFDLGAAANDVALWVAGGASDRGESFDAWKTAGEAKFVRIVAKGGDVSGESVDLETHGLSNAKVLRLFTRPAYDATLTGLVGSRSAAGVGSYIDTLDTPNLTDRLVADVTAPRLSGGEYETIFSARRDNASGDRTMTSFIKHNQGNSTFRIDYGAYNGTSAYMTESAAFTAAGARFEVTLNANKASVTPSLLAETAVKSVAETADAGGTLLLFATRAQTASGVIANHLGKFTLHSFKWYAADGTLKHDYVPVRGAGDDGKNTVYDAKEGKLLTVTKAGAAGDFGGEVATSVTGSLTHSDVINVTPAQANDWVTRPSIQPMTWAVGGAAGTLTLGVAASGGTVACSHDQADLQNLLAGTHTVTFTVAHVDGWTDLDPVNINVTVTGGVVTDKDGWVNPDGGDWATSSNWGKGLVPGVANDLALFNASEGGYGSIWPITVNNTADRTLKWLSAAQNANVTIDFGGNTLTANSSTSSSIGSPAENINGGDCLVVTNSTVTLRNGTYKFKTFEMVGPDGSRPEIIIDGSTVNFYGKKLNGASGWGSNIATYGGQSAAKFHRHLTVKNGSKVNLTAGYTSGNGTMGNFAAFQWTAPVARNEFHMTVDGEGSELRYGEFAGQGSAPNFLTVLNGGKLYVYKFLAGSQQQSLILDTKGVIHADVSNNEGFSLGTNSKIEIGDGMIYANYLWANGDDVTGPISTVNITVPETGYNESWYPFYLKGPAGNHSKLHNLTFRIDVSKWTGLAELQSSTQGSERRIPIIKSIVPIKDNENSDTDKVTEETPCIKRTQFPNLPVDISAKLEVADGAKTINVLLTKVSPDFPDPPTPPVDPSDNEETYTWAQNLLLGWWHANNWQSTGVDPQFPNSPNATARYVAPSAGVSTYWTKANGNVALFNLKFDASAPTIIDIADHTLNASIDPSETTAVSANTTTKTGGTLADSTLVSNGHSLGLYKSRVTLTGEGGTYKFNGLELVTDKEALYSELVITNTTVNMYGVKSSTYSGLYTAMQIPLNGAGNASPQSTKDHNWIRVKAGGEFILGENTMLCMNRAQALNLEADGGEITLPYGVAHESNPQAYIVRAKNGGTITGFSSGYQVGFANATEAAQSQMMLEADNGEINIGGTLKLSGKNQYGEATVHVAGNNGKITANSLVLNSSAVANYSTLQFDLPASGWNEAPVQISGAATGSGTATVRVNFEGYNGVPKEIPLIETTSTFPLSSYTLATEGQIPEGLTAELITIDSGKTLAISIHQIRTVVTVSFDAQNGGTNPDPIDVVQGGVYGELPTPTYSGHTFMGWFTEATGGTQVTEETVVTADAAHTLYAHWTANTYSITYYIAPGGTPVAEGINVDYGAYHPMEAEYGKAYRLSVPQAEVGYLFNGWVVRTGLDKTKAKWGYTDSPETAITGSTMVFGNANQDVYVKDLSDSRNAVQLESKWTQKSYTINFAGIDDPTPKSTTWAATPKIQNPSKGGYEFLGWEINQNDVSSRIEWSNGWGDMDYHPVVFTDGKALLKGTTTASDIGLRYASDGGSFTMTAKWNQHIELPTQLGTLTYSGASQSPTWFGAENCTMGGALSGMNAGTYKATATPNEGYCWSDGTTEAREVSWSITAKAVTIPTAINGLMYLGKYQNCIAGYDQILMTQGENTSCYGLVGDSGVRTPTFTLKDSANYQWSDGTTEVKTVPWHVDPAPITEVTLSACSATYDGTPHVPSVASLTANGKTYTSFEDGESYYPPHLTQMYSRDGTSFVEQSGFDFTSAGTIYVKVSGEPRVSGSQTLQFTINRKSIETAKVEGCYWTGEVIHPPLKVDGRLLTWNEDYTYTIGGESVSPVDVATYNNVVFTGKGNYQGSYSKDKWYINRVQYTWTPSTSGNWDDASWTCNAQDPYFPVKSTDYLTTISRFPNGAFGHEATVKKGVTIDLGSEPRTLYRLTLEGDTVQNGSLAFMKLALAGVSTFKDVSFTANQATDKVYSEIAPDPDATVVFEGDNTFGNYVRLRTTTQNNQHFVFKDGDSTFANGGLTLYKTDELDKELNVYLALTNATVNFGSISNMKGNNGHYNLHMFFKPGTKDARTAPLLKAPYMKLNSGATLSVDISDSDFATQPGTYKLIELTNGALEFGEQNCAAFCTANQGNITGGDPNFAYTLKPAAKDKGVNLVVFHKGLILFFGPAPAQ